MLLPVPAEPIPTASPPAPSRKAPQSTDKSRPAVSTKDVADGSRPAVSTKGVADEVEISEAPPFKISKAENPHSG